MGQPEARDDAADELEDPKLHIGLIEPEEAILMPKGISYGMNHPELRMTDKSCKDIKIDCPCGEAIILPQNVGWAEILCPCGIRYEYKYDQYWPI